MSKYSITFTAENTAIVFTNDKGKSEPMETLATVSTVDAMQLSRKEIAERTSIGAAMLSLVTHILANSSRFDAYKGQTPANEGIPKELKNAFQEQEVKILEPIFVSQLGLKEKGNKDATIAKQWDSYIKELRDGGSYANAKSTALQYFAIVGKLPYVNEDNRRLLPVRAMQKIIANMRTATPHKGIVGKLSDIRDEFNNRTDKTLIGDVATGIALLKELLASFEGMQREELEKNTRNASLLAKPEDIAKQNQKIMEDQRNLTKELGPTLVEVSAKAMAIEATRRASKLNAKKEKPVDAQEVKA